ncbi:MAG: hypothetical protein ACREXU_15150 [Gammaproteobacteria bacterium]
MRIASLIASSIKIVCALGFGDDLLGVSSCDVGVRGLGNTATRRAGWEVLPGGGRRDPYTGTRVRR